MRSILEVEICPVAHLQLEVVISTIFQGCDKGPKTIRASSKHHIDWLIHAYVLRQIHGCTINSYLNKLDLQSNHLGRFDNHCRSATPFVYDIGPMTWMRPLSDVCDSSFVKYYLLTVSSTVPQLGPGGRLPARREGPYHRRDSGNSSSVCSRAVQH